MSRRHIAQVVLTVTVMTCLGLARLALDAVESTIQRAAGGPLLSHKETP
ncbi:MAG: hypothetical protein ACYDAD_15125 [Acidimicrobiales bacterium]